MRLKVVPDTFLEWSALKLNLVPLPLLHGQVFPVISKAVLLAADKGIFAAVDAGHRTGRTVAAACGLQEIPASQLLQVLASSGYFRYRRGEYHLTPMARKWTLQGSASDLSDLLVYNHKVVWKWMEHMETYLETGRGINYHASFGPEEWELYQKAMQAVARSEVKEFSRKCPVPAVACRMLDIGGAHGLHVKAILERYPGVEAHILDLPGALGARPHAGIPGISYIEGDILEITPDPGSYDLILLSSLAHHFSFRENEQIAKKAADALRPGGVFVINEFVSPGEGSAGELVGATGNLFFGLTSTSGTWTIEQTQQWQREAGLAPLKPIGYTAIPGRFQMAARKEQVS